MRNACILFIIIAISIIIGWMLTGPLGIIGGALMTWALVFPAMCCVGSFFWQPRSAGRVTTLTLV
jgi:hypothetical protein